MAADGVGFSTLAPCRCIDVEIDKVPG